MLIDAELVRRWFAYDPTTGQLSRKLKQRSNIPDVLGSDRTRVDFFGTRYQVTHIIWMIQHGRWPIGEIDHENHNRTDRRFVNLREVTHGQNTMNRRFNNPYGKGVTYRLDRKIKPWQAQIQVNGAKKHLGFFSTSEEAAGAYKQAAIQYHGEFACVE